jgi:hypothetical protein
MQENYCGEQQHTSWEEQRFQCSLDPHIVKGRSRARRPMLHHHKSGL